MKTSHRPLLVLGASLLALFSAPAHAADSLRPDQRYAIKQRIKELQLQTRDNTKTTRDLKTLSLPAKPQNPPATSYDDTKDEVEDLTKKLEKDEIDATWLRKHGFAINMGYGYFADLKDYAPDIQVRYNFLQRLQTEDAIKATAAEAADKPIPPKGFTDFAGWIGYPLQKLETRKTPTEPAGAHKESPLLVGLGVGLGRGYQASSAVSLNVGVALFRNEAFKRNQLYVGVSLDAIVFKALTKVLASTTSDEK